MGNMGDAADRSSREDTARTLGSQRTSIAPMLPAIDTCSDSIVKVL